MSDDIDALIASGLALPDAANAIACFLDLSARYPDHPLVLFETGGVFDSAGEEMKAVSYYRRALALGLPEAVMPRLMVQLGSSLRNLGEHAEAIALLREGRARYPDDRMLRAFYALALFSGGHEADALAEMLEMTLDTDDFYTRYTRSLRGYAAALRDTADVLE